MAQAARHPLGRLLRYARPHRRTIAWATACSVLNKLFDLAPPVLIGAAVDIVVRREASILGALGVTSPTSQLWVLSALTLVIWGLESAFEYAYAWLWRNLAQTLQHELRLDAYGHLQALELAYFEDQSTGGLLAIVNDDVNQLERFLDGGANALLQVATTVLVIGSIFFALAPHVAWMAMLPMPFILWGSIRFQRYLSPRYAAVREANGFLSAQLENNLSGVQTIKSFAAEDREVERIRSLSQSYRERNGAAIALSSAFSPLIRMVIVLGFTSMLLFGGMLVLEGGLAVGAYSVLVFMTQRLLWPLTRLGETLDLYRRAMASTDRIFSVLDTKVGIRSGAERAKPGTVRGEVAFDDVTFAYRSGPDVIRHLSLTIDAGRTVAVVGATGAGKTTLMKLLLRFYDATRGAVRIDGRDIRELDLGDLRRAIGLVSQDVFLFHGTVRENIAYGTFDASDEAIEGAARLAEAHDFIAQLPLGYDTVVGERGQKLSGGQRQRISIARAIVKDPPVLIFDEATSSVDNETEAAIQRSLSRVAENRTTVIIAHRLSTVRAADRIVVLKDGSIAEQGTHEDLVSQGGIYADLWRVQTGESVAVG